MKLCIYLSAYHIPVSTDISSFNPYRNPKGVSTLCNSYFTNDDFES